MTVCLHVFGLCSLPFRRIDDDMGRTHELEHSAIKCMRGILYCYMRQADKVSVSSWLSTASACLHKNTLEITHCVADQRYIPAHQSLLVLQPWTHLVPLSYHNK